MLYYIINLLSFTTLPQWLACLKCMPLITSHSLPNKPPMTYKSAAHFDINTAVLPDLCKKLPHHQLNVLILCTLPCLKIVFFIMSHLFSLKHCQSPLRAH